MVIPTDQKVVDEAVRVQAKVAIGNCLQWLQKLNAHFKANCDFYQSLREVFSDYSRKKNKNKVSV